jgi:hypothetical protein
VTTPLVRTLAREILVAGTSCRVVLSAGSITLTRKGGRKEVEIIWDELLTWHKSGEATPREAEAPRGAIQAPRSVLADIADQVRAAAAALTRADATLTQAGALPPQLRMELRGDPQFGQPPEREDWFIEPLLTEREVASVLRVSTRAVRRLPLRSVSIAGEQRYRQSELRHYLSRLESGPRR